MSKSGKKNKTSAVTNSGGKWEQNLNIANFEDENWKANISMIVGNRAYDYENIDILSATVKSGLRRLFSAVVKYDLYNQVKELGNPKNKKPKNVPANFEVCEICKTFLDNEEEVPLPLLAKLIKFCLLAIKDDDIKRKEAEKKAALEKEKAKKVRETGKDSQTKSTKKVGKKTSEPQSAKDGSKLMKRGEEDKENKYIDDEPDDGANHYILLVGFNHPHLPQFLAEIGINLSSIIRVSVQHYANLDPLLPPLPPSPQPLDVGFFEKDDKTKGAEDAARASVNNLAVELVSIWKDVVHLLRNNPDQSKLHDVAHVDYEVKSLQLPSNYDDEEQRIQFGLVMFEDVACLIYDLQDARRLYDVYLQNLRLINLPKMKAQNEDKSAMAAATSPETHPASVVSLGAEDSRFEGVVQLDMRYYHRLMNHIPQESVSVTLIMHCMLEQTSGPGGFLSMGSQVLCFIAHMTRLRTALTTTVIASEENRNSLDDDLPETRSDGLNRQVAGHLTSVALQLALSEEEHKFITEFIELPKRSPEGPYPPCLINIHDNISIRSHHISSKDGFHPESVELEMLRHHPLVDMCHVNRPDSSVARAHAARLQELIHFSANNQLSPSEIDRAFKQFVFESMDLTTTDSNGFLLTREAEGLHESSIPWDDPYPFFMGMVPSEAKFSEIHLKETGCDEDGSESQSQSGNDLSTPDDTDRSLYDEKDSTEHSNVPHRKRHCSSADSKKGILRSRSNTPVRSQSRSNSVHFEVPTDHRLDLEVATDAFLEHRSSNVMPEQSMEEAMTEVVLSQKRILDQWCFAEHYPPAVLPQVLRDAAYQLPYPVTYNHKRDQTAMLVLHNPYNRELQNHVDWHTELHSNLGFRNYLENVAESIADWLKEKEAEYQAHFLSMEVEKIRQADEVEHIVGMKKRNRSSRKSAHSKSSKGTSSASSSADSSTAPDPCVRSNSIKAWQAEQDRMKAEQEGKESVKKDKRSRIASKGKPEKEHKAEKRPESQSSTKSKFSLNTADAAEVEESLVTKKEPEKVFWPFTGYDTGNKLLHASGVTTTLFPSDGGQIRSERTEFVQGTVSVNTTILKDGHVFGIHILNPLEGGEELPDPDIRPPMVVNVEDMGFERGRQEAEQEGKEKEDEGSEKLESDLPFGQFGSLTAHLADGMVLSFSRWGETGQNAEGQPYTPAPYVRPATPRPALQVGTPTKSKKEKSKENTFADSAPSADEEPILEECLKEKISDQDFQQIFLTCPNGLHVRYFLESFAAGKRRLLVKQSFPSSASGSQQCPSGSTPGLTDEISRVMTTDGAVIKNMMDGTVEVFFADGTVAVYEGRRLPSHGCHINSPIDSSLRHQGTLGLGKARSNDSSSKVPEHAAVPFEDVEGDDLDRQSFWTVTRPNGDRCRLPSHGRPQELEGVTICVAFDPDTKQTMATREDKVMIVSDPDGGTVAEHRDGTRITVYYRVRPICEGQDIADGEEAVDVLSERVKFVKMECPGYAKVEFNCSTSENLTVFGSGSRLNVFPDGYYILHHSGGGRMEVDTVGTMVYFPRTRLGTELVLSVPSPRYVMRHAGLVICETVDPDGNAFSVKNTGDFCVLLAGASDSQSDSSEEQMTTDPVPWGERRPTRYGQHAPRFFVVHADGGGTELLRYQDLSEYITLSESDPTTAVLKEPLPEYPGVLGVTILRPHLHGLSDRWLTGYDQPSIVPKGIRSRDLTTLPAREYKTPGPKFGTATGQGLSVGEAAKAIAVQPIVKCPAALEVRQFVQYKPVSQEMRERLRSCLRQYAECVTERNRHASLMSAVDPRADAEKMAAANMAAMSTLKSTELVNRGCIKKIYEAAVAPPPPSVAPTPQPRRTDADWERDYRELAEEAEGRRMLRCGEIPPYFDSEFGKSFLLTQTKQLDDLLKDLSVDLPPLVPNAVSAEDGSYKATCVENVTYTSDHCQSQTVLRQTEGGHVDGADNQRESVVNEAHPANTTADLAAADPPASHPLPDNSASVNTSRTIPHKTVTGADGPVRKVTSLRGRRSHTGQSDQHADLCLPTSLLGGRPSAQANLRYARVEDPVRRRIRNVGAVGVTRQGATELRRLRGLNVFPEEVDFGVLCEGRTYAFVLQLRNTGVDSCRFNVSQPPPYTGLRVLYRHGAVAAGMTCDMRLELYAIAVGLDSESGSAIITHQLEIVTETDIISVPFAANKTEYADVISNALDDMKD